MSAKASNQEPTNLTDDPVEELKIIEEFSVDDRDKKLLVDAKELAKTIKNTTREKRKKTKTRNLQKKEKVGDQYTRNMAKVWEDKNHSNRLEQETNFNHAKFLLIHSPFLQRDPKYLAARKKRHRKMEKLYAKIGQKKDFKEEKAIYDKLIQKEIIPLKQVKRKSGDIYEDDAQISWKYHDTMHFHMTSHYKTTSLNFEDNHHMSTHFAQSQKEKKKKDNILGDPFKMNKKEEVKQEVEVTAQEMEEVQAEAKEDVNEEVKEEVKEEMKQEVKNEVNEKDNVQGELGDKNKPTILTETEDADDRDEQTHDHIDEIKAVLSFQFHHLNNPQDYQKTHRMDGSLRLDD